tara:strand:- start:4584 stop:5144 length:561 start_codon:yes stop_codon:yes gene_type:complete
MENIITVMNNYINTYLPDFFMKFVVSMIILLIGLIVGRILGKLIHKVLHEIELNNILKKATGLKVSLEEIISSFVTYFTYFVFIIIAIEKLGVGAIVLNIVAGGVMLVIILSVFLSIKDFVPNCIAGITIYREGFIKKGDFIKVKETEGKITKISLIETRIETKGKDTISIPNSIMTKNEVVKLNK